MPPQKSLDLDHPRTIPEIIFTTISVWVRYSWLMLPLAAVLVVPYEVLLSLFIGSVEHGRITNKVAEEELLLALAGAVVVSPLVAAMQVHALEIIGEAQRPRYGEVLRRSLPVLLNVIAATIIAGILVFVGLILFIIPGVYLVVRLVSVAQAAAIERLDWISALRRSMELTRGKWWRTCAVVFLGAIIEVTVQKIANAATNSNHGVNAGLVIVMIVTGLLTISFSALLSGVLYFDLRARTDQHTGGDYFYPGA